MKREHRSKVQPLPINSSRPTDVCSRSHYTMYPPYPKRASLEGLEIEIFKLVSCSATPEQWREWLTVPLEHAAARGNLDLFNKLLGAGANGAAGWRGCRGRTLLDAAALGGNEDIVSGLRAGGAQPEVNVVSVSSGRPALSTAVSCGQEAVARRFIDAEVDVNFEDPIDKRSVLHKAVNGGHDQLVECLVISGADLNARDGCGGTPLHIAADGGFCGIVSTLLVRGAGKDAFDNKGNTPLMRASEEGHLRVVKTLLAAGADFNIRNDCALSALDLASKGGHAIVVRAILGHGAEVDSRSDEGLTALHVAAEYDQAGTVDALVEAGAGIELKTGIGRTPLLNAAKFSKCSGMFALLQHGASVTARTIYGNTALHLACFGKLKGLEATVDLLLRWGADETALNDEGKTPADRLEIEHGDGNEDRATRDEVERTCVLLSGAPSDRAWRRRGWLVMLRSRACDKKTHELEVGCDRKTDGEQGIGASGVGADSEGGGCKVPRSESGVDADDDMIGRSSHGENVHDRARDEDAGVNSNGVTVSLVGAEMKSTRSTTDEDTGEFGGGVDAEESLMVVRSIVGRGLEGVFRTVVGFL